MRSPWDRQDMDPKIPRGLACLSVGVPAMPWQGSQGVPLAAQDRQGRHELWQVMRAVTAGPDGRTGSWGTSALGVRLAASLGHGARRLLVKGQLIHH